MNPDIFDAPPAVATRTAPSPELMHAFDSLESHPIANIVPPASATHEAQSSDPMALVHMAVERGYDEVRLARIIDLVNGQLDRQKNEALLTALVAFKRTAPTIVKDKHVSFPSKGGTTEYDHATLAKALKVLNIELSAFGLVVTWNPETVGPSRVRVTTMLEHVGGGRRVVVLEADFDQSGGKNTIQGQGSAISYLERYGTFSVLGLASEDQDDDGRATAAANTEQIIGENILEGLLAKLPHTKTDAEALALFRIGRDSIEATKNIAALNEFRAAVEARRLELRRAA